MATFTCSNNAKFPPTSSIGNRIVAGHKVQTTVTNAALNRVYDTVAGSNVYWVTPGAPDPNGVRYPGPGIYGSQTSNYRLIDSNVAV